MKNIKKTMAAVMMIGVLTFGATFANAGILMTDLSGNNQGVCKDAKENGGIILSDLTDDGIIVNGFNDGIIVNGFAGIIVNGLTGIIVNGFNETSNACGARN